MNARHQLRPIGSGAVLCDLLLACAVLVLSACSFSDTQKHCSKSTDCGSGQDCYKSFCIRAAPGRVAAGSSASPANRTTPTAGNTPVTGTMLSPTKGSGVDAATDARVTQHDAMPAPNQPTPDAATVPSVDAGSPASCGDGELRACTLENVSVARCSKGMQRCSGGVFGPCIADVLPSDELCNGVDDNCNGMVDENITMPCYPSGAGGCTISADGKSDCHGICRTGKSTCSNGQFGACVGAVTPQLEVCTKSGTAADENCDGATDEVCTCTGSETRACYTGPAGTAGIGKCTTGTQVCNGGNFGPCTGAIIPAAESCLNEGADDDCDGIADNLKDRGGACTVPTNHGPCQTGSYQCQPGGANLVCVTPAPGTETCNNIDDNCDGMVDEPFNFMSDPAHCGNCATACASGDSCCAGKCVNTKLDVNNCGGCGANFVCKVGNGCCDSKCMDVSQDSKNCGACGRTCLADESCCAGTCINTKTDLLHCGKCETACGADAKACCGGKCSTLTTDTDCGSCGHGCSQMAASCSCGTLDGGVACVGPTPNMCL